MKTKKFEKKFTLNKKTIANLSNEQMDHVKGGCASKPGETSCHTYHCTINTCFTRCCSIAIECTYLECPPPETTV
jgi:hypothetical protein